MQLKDGVPVNDDEGLEHEADVMGTRRQRHPACAGLPHRAPPTSAAGVIQGTFRVPGKTYNKNDFDTEEALKKTRKKIIDKMKSNLKRKVAMIS